MLFTTAAMTNLKHRTIKPLKFMLATWDLGDIVPSGLWAAPYLSLEAEGRQVRLIFFSLICIIYFILVTVSTET